MKTECTLNIDGFRFTITEKTEKGYSLEIERQDGPENILAYGTLEGIADMWVLMEMTFEEAHPLVYLMSFQNDLWALRKQAFPEVVKYYEANRQPDVFEICDKILENRKAI